jgi:hypothetical protein
MVDIHNTAPGREGNWATTSSRPRYGASPPGPEGIVVLSGFGSGDFKSKFAGR